MMVAHQLQWLDQSVTAKTLSHLAAKHPWIHLAIFQVTSTKVLQYNYNGNRSLSASHYFARDHLHGTFGSKITEILYAQR